MFEQSVGAGRGESQHIQGIFVVSLTWVHLYNVMSHIDCLSRRTCDEFRCGLCNIIYKSPTLTRNRKDSVCCSPTEQSPVDSRSNCQTQKHPAGSHFRTMEFSYEEPFYHERTEEIIFMQKTGASAPVYTQFVVVIY